MRGRLSARHQRRLFGYRAALSPEVNSDAAKQRSCLRSSASSWQEALVLRAERRRRPSAWLADQSRGHRTNETLGITQCPPSRMTRVSTRHPWFVPPHDASRNAP